jgi:2'-5' RNA ligase
VRLFFAVELSNEARGVLGRLRPTDDREYRWVDPALLHLTLAFLGEQAEDRLPLLEQIGIAAATGMSPGVLRLGETGQFGGHRSPRVLWVDVAGDVDGLLALQRNLSDGLRHSGFDVEDREFRAHITLARRRETAHGGPPPGWPPTLEHVPFRLDHLTLMQSRLSPRGPTYTPVFRFAPGG